MLIEVKGLVLKTADIGESDRLVTLFTKELGNVSALAKGARSLKSRHMAAAQQFCYASFVLYKKNDRFWVKEVSLIESFFGLRSSIECFSLAGYIVEVLSDVTTATPEEDLLRLALNSLYALANGKYSHDKIKAAFEIRALAMIGYMPDILACRDCGMREGNFFFDIMAGNIQCYGCRDKEIAENAMVEDDPAYRRIVRILSEGAKTALGSCIYAPLERLFSFNIPDEDMKLFSSAAEDYLVNQLERSFKSLDFYKEVKR